MTPGMEGRRPERHLTVALIGHPNCGKTTLFNALTGARQYVGNWPGVTVDGVRGQLTVGDTCIDLVDLPGTYTLTTPRSLDERVTAEAVASGAFDLILNVIDGPSAERSLYLTAQVLESQGSTGCPVLVVANRMDRAAKDGLTLVPDALTETLGCPVVETSATTGSGIEALRHAMIEAAAQTAPAFPAYPNAILQRLEALAGQRATSRWATLCHLESQGDTAPDSGDAAESAALGAARHAFVATAIAAGVRRAHRDTARWTDRIDALVLHPWAGVPVFLAAMYLMFLWTIHIGGAFVDAFDGVFGAVLVDGLGSALTALGLPDWLRVVIADGLGRGVQTIATFIPIIACLYLFLSALEESGYMARAAVVMDRFMRGIGLPGKAFVPLIVGLGCNVPAVMAARTLEDAGDRKATIAMTPFMSCGARLPVYALFAAAFFPTHGQNLVFLLYILGIAVAVLTGFVLKRTLFGGRATPLLVELPTYQAPALSSVLRRTGDRVGTFVLDAGKVIVPVVMVLSVLNAVSTDGRVLRGDSGDSVLAAIGKAATPLFAPIGIAEDNWPATVGLFTGIFAKEAVVGTLDALYSAQAQAGAAAPEPPPSLGTAIGDALATIPDNLGALAGALLDPLGINVGDVSTTEAAAGAQGVNVATFGALTHNFDGAAAAFSYLVFVLLYAPCVATVAAIRREAGGLWTGFTLAWSTGMGFGVATLVYQSLTFTRHPGASLLAMAVVLTAFGAAVLVLRKAGGALKLSAAQAPACGGCSGCKHAGPPRFPTAGGGCH